MTPTPKKKEYLIMDKATGHVVHEGADRRSILPNAADFKTQAIITIIGVVLTSFMLAIGYCGDMAYRGIVTSIVELKSSNEATFQKIYTHLSISKANGDNQFTWLQSQCCQNAKLPPPESLPQ